jgi:hypothetical protein
MVSRFLKNLLGSTSCLAHQNLPSKRKTVYFYARTFCEIRIISKEGVVTAGDEMSYIICAGSPVPSNSCYTLQKWHLQYHMPPCETNLEYMTRPTSNNCPIRWMSRHCTSHSNKSFIRLIRLFWQRESISCRPQSTPQKYFLVFISVSQPQGLVRLEWSGKVKTLFP